MDPTSEGPLWSGVLLKEASRLRAKWNTYFFVILPEAIEHYDSEEAATSGSAPHARIVLSEAELTEVKHPRGDKFALRLEMAGPDGKPVQYVLAAETAAARLSAVDALLQAGVASHLADNSVVLVQEAEEGSDDEGEGTPRRESTVTRVAPSSEWT